MQEDHTTSSTVTVEAPVSSDSKEEDKKEKKEKVLHLKLRAKEDSQHIKWSEDTVDNENMGKKSSKRCCIYHKHKAFGDSDSDESDSDTEKAAAEGNRPDRPKNYQRFHA